MNQLMYKIFHIILIIVTVTYLCRSSSACMTSSLVLLLKLFRVISPTGLLFTVFFEKLTPVLVIRSDVTSYAVNKSSLVVSELKIR